MGSDDNWELELLPSSDAVINCYNMSVHCLVMAIPGVLVAMLPQVMWVIKWEKARVSGMVYRWFSGTDATG